MPSHLKDFPSPLSSPQRQDRPGNTPKIPQRTLSADLEECTLLQGYLQAAHTRPMLCGECEELVLCFPPLCFNLSNQRPQLLL